MYTLNGRMGKRLPTSRVVASDGHVLRSFLGQCGRWGVPTSSASQQQDSSHSGDPAKAGKLQLVFCGKAQPLMGGVG